MSRLPDKERATTIEPQAALDEQKVSIIRTSPMRSFRDESRQSGISLLNNDVLEVLFEHLDTESTGTYPDFSRTFESHRRCSFFASLCLVSRSWLHVARRLLYRAIPILQNDFDRLSKFVATLKYNPTIRTYIRRLHISIISEKTWPLTLEAWKLLPRSLIYFTSKDLDLGIENAVVAAAVEAMEDSDAEDEVEEDEIEDGGLIEEIGYDAGLRLESFANQALLELPLHSLASACLPTVSWSPALWATAFTAWSSLESLDLRDNAYTMTHPPDEFQIDGLPSLRALTLRDMDESYIIPPTSSNTLHTLIVLDCTVIPEASLCLLISKHSDSLRSLVFQFVAGGAEVDYIRAASFARKLERFQCNHANTTSLSVLSPCITEAVYSFVFTADPDAITAFLHASPQLKTLFCQFWGPRPTSTIDPLKQLWSKVQNVAERRGVKFGCSRHSGFPSEGPDWVIGLQEVKDQPRVYIAGYGLIAHVDLRSLFTI
jgi:hypothetical protein